MVADTSIEWTDKVWNPVTGCTKVSAGCKNCYAERVANRFWGEREFSLVMFHPERLRAGMQGRIPDELWIKELP